MKTKEMTESEKSTREHIQNVNKYLNYAADEFLLRGELHDASKLDSPEKEYFEMFTAKLKGLTYGSDEYKECLKELEPALNHHYANNSHHPEYYENGIDGMNLFDIIEMFFDWKAASERHNDGNIYKSIELNQKRFKMTEQLTNIFKNTALFCGFKPSKEC